MRMPASTARTTLSTMFGDDGFVAGTAGSVMAARLLAAFDWSDNSWVYEVWSVARRDWSEASRTSSSGVRVDFEVRSSARACVSEIWLWVSFRLSAMNFWVCGSRPVIDGVVAMTSSATALASWAAMVGSDHETVISTRLLSVGAD